MVMEEVGALGVLGERLGLKLHYADVRTMAGLRVRLAPLGVTPARATALVYIALNAGCDQMSLGRSLGINRASTVKVVNELEALGVIERRPGRDRRANALYLTPAGVVLRQRVEKETLEHDRAAFSGLSSDEKALLSHLLSKISYGDLTE
jgi:DNA-binding MarR family transcriptional regulator